MNRPSLSVRVAGSPVGALSLWCGCAFMFVGWYQGHTAWWLALACVGVAARTLRAVKQLRTYNAWAAEWNAMGDDGAPATPKKRGWVPVAVAALLAMTLTFGFSSDAGTRDAFHDALNLLWAASWVYLVFATIRGVWRWKASRQVKVRHVEGELEAAPVAWLVGRASSSPSRREAQRNLPEYSARLIAARQEDAVTVH